jgi:hypothetical protein
MLPQLFTYFKDFLEYKQIYPVMTKILRIKRNYELYFSILFLCIYPLRATCPGIISEIVGNPTQNPLFSSGTGVQVAGRSPTSGREETHKWPGGAP